MSASLTWAIQKARRADGERAGGFPGAEVIFNEVEHGSARKRVGLRPTGRAPMREGVTLFARETDTDPIGTVTSGGFGPSIEGPVAMGYVAKDLTTLGTILFGEVRGKRMPVEVTALPFVPANFKR